MKKRSSCYCLGALALLIIAEVLALAAIRIAAWRYLGVLALIAGVIFAVIWRFNRTFGAGFKLKNTTLRRMLANAISPTWPGVAYLLAFVLHIGWTSNAINSIFVSNRSDLPLAFASFGLSVIGMVVLIIFFPEGKVDKSRARKVVFISGISIIGVDKKDDKRLIISIRNIVPLVSILDLVFKDNSMKKENVGEFLILDTDGHHKTLKDKISLKDVNDNNDWDNCFVVTDGVEGDSRCIPLPWRPAPDDKKAVQNLIVWLIKFTAKLKYPGNDAFIDGLKITFMDKPCDYDHFDQCFKVVKDAIDAVDDREHLLYFNLTPGTGIVGSLMTLFAIDDNRRLFYYSQNTTKVITEANKNKVPLENLLSQALESINNQ